MTERPGPSAGEPGTLTSLLNDVFRGSGPEQLAWVEALAPGATLGRYDLIREVGRGGSAVVWEARDRELGRRVAVKVIRARGSSTPETRLIAEAEIAARLSHPGIVTTLDVGRNEKGAWLVQEFLVGRTLDARIEEGPLRLRDALGIAVKVAAALAYTHAHGVIHRDLTAANVFLCEDGQVKLLDLGMAQAFGRRKLEGGTPDYMAPEQARGLPEDERVDVYALGVILHRMLTGQSPFAAKAPPERRRPPLLDTPEVPGLAALIGRMLATDPGDRPRDATAVAADLDALCASLPPAATTTSPGIVRVRTRSRGWILAGGGVGVVAVAIGLGMKNAPAVGGATGPVAFGSAATSNACQWGSPTWTGLDKAEEIPLKRNGELGGQGVTQVAGRDAWKITSDWGQILLPLGHLERADTFAAEVDVFIPPDVDWERTASLSVFTDPEGGPKTDTLAHGVTLRIGEDPGKAPWFDWRHEARGLEPASRIYVGTFPGPVSGKWHRMRIEGSRSRKWFRGLLDGRTIVVGYGDHDLGGSHIALGARYGYMKPEDVAFSNLRTFAGTGECQ